MTIVFLVGTHGIAYILAMAAVAQPQEGTSTDMHTTKVLAALGPESRSAVKAAITRRMREPQRHGLKPLRRQRGVFIERVGAYRLLWLMSHEPVLLGVRRRDRAYSKGIF